MSVFTTVSPEQLSQWLQDYSLGELLDLKGIASGITNTNYFVTTTTGRYVLTLFEENTAEELPFFLDLITHLSERDIPCPHPYKNRKGQSLSALNGKPAAIVSCLPGRSVEHPSVQQCAAMGRIQAQMHLAGMDFPFRMKNLRDSDWRRATASKVREVLGDEDRQLLDAQLAYEAALDTEILPKGIIHADLFRDNVLFDSDRLGGIIDFYYACWDVLLYDVAIAVNDWCVQPDGSFDPPRLQAYLQAYHAIRPFTVNERALWMGMLRTAAMRFWLSRLHDMHFPSAGELTHAKDPGPFRNILQHRMATAQEMSANLLENKNSLAI